VTFGTRRPKSAGHRISQEETTMATLVVYAIRYGATQGIAGRIAVRRERWIRQPN
jgi:hypothetical protein